MTRFFGPREPRRLANSHVVQGLVHMQFGEQLLKEGNLDGAATQFWCARDKFTQSSSLDASKYREQAQERLDHVRKRIQEEVSNV